MNTCSISTPMTSSRSGFESWIPEPNFLHVEKINRIPDRIYSLLKTTVRPAEEAIESQDFFYKKIFF